MAVSRTDSRVDLKNPAVAAVLAFLIPGAGHFYQRRYFKAGLYSVCILSAYFTGQCLGDWKTTYAQHSGGKKHIGYFSQVMVGLPALPAIVQTVRYAPSPGEGDMHGHRADEKARILRAETFDTEFVGRIGRVGNGTTIGGTIEGRITLAPTTANEFGQPEARGTFQGTFTDDEGNTSPIELTLTDPVEIGPRIHALEDVTYQKLTRTDDAPLFSSTQRYLRCTVVESDYNKIEGTVPRSVLDWYQVPLDNRSLQYLWGTLGKKFELALNYTWVAGLLNLLAIWDAYEGPAYGYGDEEDEDEDDESGKKKNPETASADEDAQPATSEAQPVAAQEK